MTKTSGSTIIVVGGGLIGCSIARELAGCGCQVILLERDRIAGEASSAAAGILCPQLDAEAPLSLMELGLESLRMYPQMVSALREETGIDPEFDSRGTLQLDLTREDEASTRSLVHRQREAGLTVERLSAGEVARLEPALSDAILGGLYFPQGALVDPVALARAVTVSARRRGAELREGSPVLRLVERGGRVTGVETGGGEILEGEKVILAAGAWSSALVPEIPVKVHPVRGQIVVLETARPPRSHALYTPRCYLAPRRDGRVLVGSTLERAGFRKVVTPKAVLKLIASALSIDPALEESSLSAAWSGLRPGTEDGLPLLGEFRPGLVVATGHYRGGILLAPVTAALVGEMVLRGKTTRPLDLFSPRRRPHRSSGEGSP